MDELEFVKYERRYHYAGMSERDRAIWERFIDAHPGAFEECAYNVAVGSGTPLDTVVRPDTGGDINRLYQRKIDVVARLNGKVWLIELKPRATTAAIGQVEGYKALFVRDFPDIPVGGTIVVTDELMPDMSFLSGETGVPVLVA